MAEENKIDDSKKDENNKTDELKDLKEELAVLKEKADEYLNGWKRAKADYINFKKEAEERQRDIIEFANLAFVLELLIVRDNFIKAFDHIPEEKKDSDWVIGVKHIKNQLDSLLEKAGVSEIKTVGEKFDPEKHEAVGKEKRKDLAEETIIKEVEKGYLMKEIVIRPAKVIVSEKIE